MISTDVASAVIQSHEGRRRPSSPIERGQRGLLLILVVLTATAWGLTIWQVQSMPKALAGVMPTGVSRHLTEMSMHDATQLAARGMAGAGWSLTGFTAFIVAWAVMMAAMMFPGLAPMLLTMHAIARHRRGPHEALRSTAVFVTGYLVVWTVVGGVTWAMVQALGQMVGRLDVAERTHWGPLVLGGALITAGLYQLTPFKQMCLDSCRSPVIVVMQRWREGYGGALRMGLGHGLYCLGCCWALFTVLVAAGIMSLAWMLALTLIDVAEKTLPMGRRVAQGVGVSLLILGIALAARVIGLPWDA